MTDLGPTSMLDPFVEGWAREAGMDTKQLSSIIGGNVMGGAITIPFDMFFTQLGSKVASFFAGAAGLLLGTYSLKGQGRLQLDTMQIGARIMTEVLDPSPDDIKMLQKQVGDFVDGLLQGRFDKVAYAFIRNPKEITSLVTPPAQKETEKKGETALEKENTGQPSGPQGLGKVVRL